MVQGESETIDKLAMRLKQKAQQCQQCQLLEAQIRDQISQTVGLKSCDVKFWRKFRLSALNFVRTGTEL